jgi:hypothetical protein
MHTACDAPPHACMYVCISVCTDIYKYEMYDDVYVCDAPPPLLEAHVINVMWHMYVCMYVIMYIYVCMYVCTYVYVCMHTSKKQIPATF